jgi:hypothetical protein
MDEFRCRALTLGLAAGLFLGLAAGVRAEAQEVRIDLGSRFGQFSVVAPEGHVSVSSRIEVERLVDGTWQDSGVAKLMLREDCSPVPSRLPACRTLAPSQSVKVQPWTGYICNAQCSVGCHGEGFAQPGETFRIVVKSCDGAQSWFSKPMHPPQ